MASAMTFFCFPFVVVFFSFLLEVKGKNVELNPDSPTFVYDGHGALSAGASSRLLFDYPEPQRSQILDYLFKPNFGASLHLLKVEIGGDSQSTDGTEASHMHYRDDLGCERGYEYWLLQEARARNPNIKTYALSWAVPYWVGNQTGYYCSDNIDYHIKWLQCVRDYYTIGNIDYIGNWNERPWGTPQWTVAFRAALDEAGFTETEIIIPDGGIRGANDTIFEYFANETSFYEAVAGIGVHYPCDKPVWEISGLYGKKYWASEDYSTVGNWAGAGCWGRILNQNFVRMNMTSTIAWSLIWSVYPQAPYYGNGLMYAFSPWSGFYSVNPPIWTSAHTCQFTEPGWLILSTAGGGSGNLTYGGSYVTMVSPPNSGPIQFSLIIEKLEGDCLRCAGEETQVEDVTFVLTGELAQFRTLSLWATNKEFHFFQMPNVSVDFITHSFTLTIEPDSIYTVSSTAGQNHGSFPDTPIPNPSSFPRPYQDNFDSYSLDQYARYFADDGGCFLVAEAPPGIHGEDHGLALKQFVINQAGVNEWVEDTEPISLIGSDLWEDYNVSVEVYIIPSVLPTGPAYGNIISLFNYLCLENRGQSVHNGTLLDTAGCSNTFNYNFYYDSSSGLIHEMNTSFCIAESPCQKHVPICQVICDASSPSQMWLNGSDFSLRMRDSPSMCLTSNQTADGGGLVYVEECQSPLPNYQQWFIRTLKPQYAGVCARMSGKEDRLRFGYCLNLFQTGEWEVTAGFRRLANGTISGNASNSWHALELRVSGEIIEALIDGIVVALEFDRAFTKGMANIQSNWGLAYFDNFSIY